MSLALALALALDLGCGVRRAIVVILSPVEVTRLASRARDC